MVKKILKTLLKIILALILIAVLAVIVIVVSYNRNPEIYIRWIAEKLTENEIEEVSYYYDFDDVSKIKTALDFYFIPSESGNYTFTVTDLKSSDEVTIVMNAMDKTFNDFFVTDNGNQEEDGQNGTMSATTTLQASQLCYMYFTIEPVNGDLAKFSGSFRLTVSRGSDDEGPPVLTIDKPVTLEVGAEGQACAIFVPPETGYYRFDNSIVSKDSVAGYSSLSSITSSNKIKVGLTNDIGALQKNKEYYVWVTANETNSKKSEIKLSCKPMKTAKASGICSLDIADESVIEYIADKNCDLAVYTISNGDPHIVIYEKIGFPLRTDDGSEASLSNNPDDIATVLSVEQGAGLHICLYGDLTDCRVVITEYKGDGTSLTLDDLEPLPGDPVSEASETGDAGEEGEIIDAGETSETIDAGETSETGEETEESPDDISDDPTAADD